MTDAVARPVSSAMIGPRIRIKAAPKRTFQMRIAGLAFREGHVLVHRAAHENFWTFPGGGGEMGEASADTLVREMREELGTEATVGRLLWSVENFFRFEGRDWHELGLYYLMDLPDSVPFHPEEIVHRIRDGKNDLEFRWVEARREALDALVVPPLFIAGEIENLPLTARHLVWDDGDLDAI